MVGQLRALTQAEIDLLPCVRATNSVVKIAFGHDKVYVVFRNGYAVLDVPPEDFLDLVDMLLSEPMTRTGVQSIETGQFTLQRRRDYHEQHKSEPFLFLHEKKKVGGSNLIVVSFSEFIRALCRVCNAKSSRIRSASRSWREIAEEVHSECKREEIDSLPSAKATNDPKGKIAVGKYEFYVVFGEGTSVIDMTAEELFSLLNKLDNDSMDRLHLALGWDVETSQFSLKKSYSYFDKDMMVYLGLRGDKRVPVHGDYRISMNVHFMDFVSAVVLAKQLK